MAGRSRAAAAMATRMFCRCSGQGTAVEREIAKWRGASKVTQDMLKTCCLILNRMMVKSAGHVMSVKALLALSRT
jgi:hypothetical protein